MREGGVGVGQRLQRNRGLGDDLQAVGAGDALLLGDAVGEKARQLWGVLAFPAQSNLPSGDELEALVRVGAMIDAYAKAGLGQVFVGDIRPAAAPLQEVPFVVPAAFFGPESVGGQRAGGEEDVGVRVVRIVEVDAQVRDHALGDEFAPRVVAEQCDLFGVGRARRASRLRSRARLGRPCASPRPRPRSTGSGGRRPSRARRRGREFRVCSTPRLRV